MKRGKRFPLVTFLFVLSFTVGLGSLAHSEERYPSKPVSMIMFSGPGGATDLCFRTIMEDLKAMQVPINILYKPGAGGMMAADAVAVSKPDGYTLLGGMNTQMTVAPAIDPTSTRDLVPIATIATQAAILINRTEHPAKTLEDLIRMAKQKPGTMTVGSVGVQSTPYFDLELIESKLSGQFFSHVPIANSNEGIANLLGGHIDSWFGTVSIAQNLLKAGRVRGLATCNPKRLNDFPDVPTFAEKGFPEVNLNMKVILYGPKGLSPEIIKIWEEALGKVMKKPSVISALNRVNFEADVAFGSEKIMKMLLDERERLAKIVKIKGIKP